ncbi:MAG TPA: hypothetical protein VMS02_01370 [Solirubrobacteraceae bacterium]|nr:hypothetical protein [Solirubrobacteraceae bacterium]
MSFAAIQEPAVGELGADAPPAPAQEQTSPATSLAREVCPLCGQTLAPEQDWCLRCGAAARTRLAAPAKWKLLVFALAAIALLSLGVLVAALVKLAG